MKKFLLAALAVGACGSLMLVQAQDRKSPHEAVSATFGGDKIEIVYGRPYAKGREIVGGLIPFDKVWRTGADEATVLRTPADLMLGSLHVPKGEYSIFTLPREGGCTLIVNKTAKQWGAFDYDATQDLGRVEMTTSELSEFVEQFTIDFVKNSESSGVLRMRWENSEASIALMKH